MIFEELHRIGRAFVVDPFRYAPPDLCPRDDVLAPDKICRLTETVADDWEVYHTPGWGHVLGGDPGGGYPVQRCWVSWSPDFADRISGVCYYALARSPELFWSLCEVAPDDDDAMYEWLAAHGTDVFVMTTTLLMYHGDASDIVYAVNCGVGTVATPLHYGATLDQMLAADAYAIGNGLLLALAMERAGRWRSGPLARALRRAGRDGLVALGGQFGQVPPEFLALYVQNGALPCAANYPALYAACGPRPCSPALRRLLLEADGLHANPTPYLQHFAPDGQACQVTSPLAAALPHLRLPADAAAAAAARARDHPAHLLHDPAPSYADDLAALRHELFLGDGGADGDGDDADGGAAPAPRADFYVMDIAGRILAIATQRSSWAWWNAGDNAERLIRSFARVGFATTTDAMDYVARRLFALHAEHLGRPRRRLRAMLKTWMLTLDPAGDAFFAWFVKYVFGRDLRLRMRRLLYGAATAFGEARPAFWNPAPPLAFFHDMLAHHGARFPLYEERTIALLTNHREAICALLGRDGAPPGPNGERSGDLLEVATLSEERPKRYRFRIAVSLYRTLKRFADGEPEARFADAVDARVAGRLAALRRAFAAAAPAHAVIESLVLDYWRRHRMDLAVPD